MSNDTGFNLNPVEEAVYTVLCRLFEDVSPSIPFGLVRQQPEIAHLTEGQFEQAVNNLLNMDLLSLRRP